MSNKNRPLELVRKYFLVATSLALASTFESTFESTKVVANEPALAGSYIRKYNLLGRFNLRDYRNEMFQLIKQESFLAAKLTQRRPTLLEKPQISSRCACANMITRILRNRCHEDCSHTVLKVGRVIGSVLQQGKGHANSTATATGSWNNTRAHLVQTIAATQLFCLYRRIRILEQSINVVRDIRVLELGTVALHRLTVLVDEELLKVPRDVGPADWRPLDGLISGLNVIDKIRACTSTIV